MKGVDCRWTACLARRNFEHTQQLQQQEKARHHPLKQHSLTTAMSFFGFDTNMPPGMQELGGDSLDERLRRMAEADENL